MMDVEGDVSNSEKEMLESRRFDPEEKPTRKSTSGSSGGIPALCCDVDMGVDVNGV